MNYSKFIPVALGAAVLAGCGGGGGGGDAPPAGNGANVALSGTAAKGLMANADVAAYPVNADGSVGTTALATTTTNPTTGGYSLTFGATQNQPYVIKVSANADGSTTHLDEATGAVQQLPAGFSMRALLVPTAAGSVTASANVTPFSELAVAAASRASGGITKANADQAASTVAQLLGFDPLAIAVKAAGAAGNTESEKKLAILLTAVSKLAGDGALGCATGSAGDKAKCVVDALGNAASTGSIKLDAGGTNVSAALGGAVAAVLADNTLNGGVDPSTLSGVTGNLACTTDCTAAPVATVSAIASAKALFTQLRSDWQALFSRGGASSIAEGATNREAWKFRQAMTGVQVPAAMLVKDLSTLLMAADFYNDYKAGRTTLTERGRAPGEVASNTPSALGVTNRDAVSCTLYQDTNLSVVATTRDNATTIGCRVSYYTTVSGTTTIDWRHGFTIVPGAAGVFDYTTRARKRTVVAGATTENLALQTNFYSGSLTTTSDASGHVTGFAVTGELPATFTQDGNTLANDHNSWSLTGSRTITGPNSGSATVAGNVVSRDAQGAALGTLTVVNGVVTEIAVSRDIRDNVVRPGSAGDAGSYGGALDSLSLDVVWATPAAAFEGVFSTTPTLWDASGTDRAPATLTLSGALRNIEGGVTTEFLKGSFTATTSGYTTYDGRLASSPSNFFTRSFQFTGTVAAPTRPTLELTMSGSKKSYEPDVGSVNMQYRALVNGTPRTVIALTGSRGANGAMVFTLTEATANLSMAWSDGATQGNLLKGSETIGVLDKGSKLLTFSDRSVMSLDFGL